MISLLHLRIRHSNNMSTWRSISCWDQTVVRFPSYRHVNASISSVFTVENDHYKHQELTYTRIIGQCCGSVWTFKQYWCTLFTVMDSNNEHWIHTSLVKHYNSWGRLTEQFPGAFTPCIQFSLLSDCCGVSRSTEYLHYLLTGESIYRLRCQHRSSEENRKYTNNYLLVPITIPADMFCCWGVYASQYEKYMYFDFQRLKRHNLRTCEPVRQAYRW